MVTYIVIIGYLFSFQYAGYSASPNHDSRKNSDETSSGLNSGEATLIETIENSFKSIDNWLASPQLAVRGTLFSKVSASDLYAQLLIEIASGDFVGVSSLLRYFKFIEFDKSKINLAKEWLLNRTPMFDNYSIPITQSDPKYFSVWHQHLFYGFEYSKELNYLQEKWNISSAFEGLNRCRQSHNVAYYSCNPDTGTSLISSGGRWMSSSNLANLYVMLSQIGSDEFLEPAIKEWRELNNHHWDQQKNAFMYARDWKIWEWSTIEVFFNFHKLQAHLGTLGNFSRIFEDLQNRYLSDVWSAPLWSNYVVPHFRGSDQLRLHATLDAWMLLHGYYSDLSEKHQEIMQNMLEGGEFLPAWEGLISNPAQVYQKSSHRFKMDSDGTISDMATAEGIFTLFLSGIIPKSGGGLLVPKRSDGYSGAIYPIDVFLLDLERQTIVIPVREETELKFIFGNIHTRHFFHKQGLYEISFDTSWNKIQRVKFVRDLDELVGVPTTSHLLPLELITDQIELSRSQAIGNKLQEFFNEQILWMLIPAVIHYRGVYKDLFFNVDQLPMQSVIIKLFNQDQV